jgi:predicted GNAT family acetyltransferase
MEHLPHILEHPAAHQDGAAPSGGTRRAHLSAVPQAAESDFPSDLAGASTRHLRTLCNRTYQLLDLDRPARETRERYDALVQELERRERQAVQRGGGDDTRETFRDNALFSRFELYRNGMMVGYVQYEMRGGDILLLHAVVDPKFRHLGLEPVLMQAVLLNAHRRRLAVVPCCTEALDFLAAHPQFLSLLPAQQRRRFRLLLAPGPAAAGQERR